MLSAEKVKGSHKHSKRKEKSTPKVSNKQNNPEKSQDSDLDSHTRDHTESKGENIVAENLIDDHETQGQENVGCTNQNHDIPNVHPTVAEVRGRIGLETADEDVVDVSLMLDNVDINKASAYSQESCNLECLPTSEVQTAASLHSVEQEFYPEVTEIKSVDYGKLLDEVKTCMEDVIEPSAPLPECVAVTESSQECYENCSYTLYNCDGIETPKLVVEKRILFDLGVECEEEALTPLSDKELSQFYYNSELSQAQECIVDFIHQEINNEQKFLNPFYELLSDYLKAKNSLQVSKHKMKDLDEKLDKYITQMWTVWNDIKAQAVGKCLDGNSISLTHNYTRAKFNQEVFENFKTALFDIRSTLFEAFKIDSFNCLRYKLKIEQYIHSLLTSCPEFSNLNESSNVSLVQASTDSYFQQCLCRLRNSIGVLFWFQRNQKVEMNLSFLQESRQWLTDLVSVLIRTGNWRDHLFILNHILRCPGGVGKWASFYIQFPAPSLKDSFSDPAINHMMTIMSILLLPIERREDFMSEWNLPSGHDEWVVVDSDEEDDETMLMTSPLRENDMVLLLNQIPLKNLFSSILGVNNGTLNPTVVTVSHLMKLFSFSSDFIKIVHSGLQVYSTERYKQFAKRLGRLMRHIIEYATDELDLFRSNCEGTDQESLDRLQTEYDNFFLKSTKTIYSSRLYGTWQFLAVVPYHRASKTVILKLYSILQLQDVDSKPTYQINLSDFEEKLQQLPESEQFYLLSTFTSIAMARDVSEVDFIKLVVRQLLYVGFLSDFTRDQCYKSVKSLLYDLCAKHPFLMSEVLYIQDETFTCDEGCDQSLSAYLWKELPIRTWKPNPQDLQILSSWLLQSPQSVRSELARIILKSLNYDVEEGNLFLPVETHRLIAYMILRANQKMPQDQEMNVIKNVSNLVGLQEPEQTLQLCSWSILLKLHLHLFDQSPSSVQNSLHNLSHHLQNIPDLVSISELHELVEQKNAMACFIALMTTTVGHSVPVIFNEGFALLEVLLRARKFEAAISCIECMTLMFLECRDSLYKSQLFTSVLSQLVNADYSYLKLAKNLKAFETPGPILLSLKNMIQNQINSCDEMGINRANVIELWLRSLTKLPLWTQEPGVIHLVDSLCVHGFFHKATSMIIKDILTAQLVEITSPSEAKSSLASFVSWMNSKSTIPTLLVRGYNGNAVWFFLKAIEIEQEICESSNFLWIELLKELFAANDKKTSIDNCLKKACTNLQIPVRTSEVLTIYRLCYQILETRLTHPMIIVLWQKFFLLYFHRVPGFVDNGSVGEKFFHGIINQNLFRRLKQRLKETFDCFSDLHKKCNEADRRGEFYLRCSQVLHVFQLWLDEPKFHEPNLSLNLLPSQFNSELLEEVIHQKTTLWMELVDYQQVHKEINKWASTWQEMKGRRVKNEFTKSPSMIQEQSLTDRIQEGLMRYENPLPPPKINIRNYTSIGLVKDVLLHSDSMGSYLKPLFRSTLDYADYYVQEMGEYIGLSCDLQDLVQLLYKTKKSSVTVKKSCNGYDSIIFGKNVHHTCSGPAVIKLTFEESEIDKKNSDLFNQCVSSFNRCVQRSLMPLQQNLGLSVVTIEKAIDELKAEYVFMRTHSEDDKFVSSLRETGVKLFYDFIHSWSESVTFVPSVTALFEECLDNLGKTFIVDNPSECESVLTIMNDNSKLTDKLQKYFNPNAAATHDFIELYSKAKKSCPEVRLALLSKFNLMEWLKEKRPRFAERSLLISEVGSGLKSYGSFPTDHLDLIKLFNSHLQQLMMYDFPEHYGEILNVLLEGSELQSIPVSTWFMFLNSLVPEGINFLEGKTDGNSFEPGQNVKKLKHSFTHYATHQNLLSLANIRETILHLANAFKSDRLKHGLYGLYPKYRYYIEPISIFCGMLSHSYVAETLKLDLGSLSMRIADQLWPLLRDLYSPWLVPYWSKQEKSQTAKWIQELTDDKCVLLPWVNSDISFACYTCSIFIDSVRFVLDTLPGINSILSHVWFFYVTNYAHIQVKDHVLRVIHKNLLDLPWSNFFPTLQDIELMVKVVEHFIPMAHSLLGNIFVEVKWTDIVRYYSTQNDLEALAKLHVYLLHLLVKLPCEPSLKQNDEIVHLLTEAKDYAWNLVDSNNYDSVLNWFVMSCDPRIVLMDDKSEYYKLDFKILQILRTCAGFTGPSKEFHPTTLTKRLMYIRANNKWLTTANSRFKCKDSALFRSAILRILNEIESTLTLAVSDSQKSDEAALLLSEFLCIFKEDELSAVAEDAMITWLSSSRCSALIYGLLRSVALSTINPAIFGNIAEASLDCYFDSNENPSWTEIISRFVMYASGQSGLQKALISNSNLLTLYAILLKHFNDNTNLLEKKIIISDIFHSLTSVKRSESMEPKMVLMIIHVCTIANIVLELDETEGISILSRLCEHLAGFTVDKGNGLLSTFGLKKCESFTIRFRLICLIASGGIMRLVKRNYPGYEDKVDEKILRNWEQANANKQYQNVSHYISFATDEMTKSESLADIIKTLRSLGLQIFNKNYLK